MLGICYGHKAVTKREILAAFVSYFLTRSVLTVQALRNVRPVRFDSTHSKWSNRSSRPYHLPDSPTSKRTSGTLRKDHANGPVFRQIPRNAQTKWNYPVFRVYHIPHHLTVSRLNPPGAPQKWFLKIIQLYTTVVFSIIDSHSISMNGPKYWVNRASTMLDNWIASEAWKSKYSMPLRPSNEPDLLKTNTVVPRENWNAVGERRRLGIMKRLLGIDITVRHEGETTTVTIVGHRQESLNQAKTLFDMYVERARQLDRSCPGVEPADAVVMSAPEIVVKHRHVEAPNLRLTERNLMAKPDRLNHESALERARRLVYDNLEVDIQQLFWPRPLSLPSEDSRVSADAIAEPRARRPRNRQRQELGPPSSLAEKLKRGKGSGKVAFLTDLENPESQPSSGVGTR